MIFMFYGFVSLIYMFIFFYSVCNYREAKNERRRDIRYAIETYSVMAILMVILYALLQFNYFSTIDPPVRTLTSNYFYDAVNAVTHLSAVVAIRVWLSVMKVRVEEEKQSLFSNRKKSVRR